MAVPAILCLLLNAGCNSGRLGDAVLANDVALATRLLNEGADPNLSYVRGQLMGILLAGDFDVVKTRTFLVTAIELQYVEMVEALLEGGADPNLYADSLSPLEYAARSSARSVDLTELLLDYGADPNQAVGFDWPSVPLYAAGDLSVSLLLLPVTDRKWITAQLVANLKQNDFGPLFSAVYDMYMRGEFPVEPGSLDAFPPLTQAIIRQDVEAFEQVLRENPASIHARDRYQFTPLSWAASRFGSIEFVRRLLDAGSAPNAEGEGRWTPLYSAVEADHPAMIALLCAAGADPNHTLRYVRNRPPLATVAAHHRHAATLEALLDAGADPLERSYNGETNMLDWAEHNATVERPQVQALARQAIARAEAERAAGQR